ncbi:hypothetical protein [Streptococcus pneumoniae]|uniref:hypothetical protein n=2 Tax=Streptococcus pneumoniae TaxID=1313 RepID=UPI00061C7603|nr:hypothetical protein [Streptococcus pneumoniae]QPN72344.1 hypothetical protein GL187_01720 [Streptococcus pneumoniae]QPN83599.1 hypothetical protein GL184_09385 [Streptococcus pneumoniae]QPN85652.1 hypothetical protein GL183_09630 [Streptococcus pneumoniae]RTZ12683.1 hypothetical protein CWI07_08405 [Streptococcus pneumoniae]CGF66621.1 chlorohydrolase [Streptococcus pneumoniae]
MVYYERKVNESLTRTLMLNENQEQTRKLALGCSKHGFEVVDKAKLVWFEEIFEEYKKHWSIKVKSLDLF